MKMFKLFFLFVALLSYSFAQEGLKGNSDDDEKEKPTYNISLSYPLLIVHTYTLDITTEVERTFSDNTKYNYGREVRYFISFYATEKPDESNLQRIFVSVDSLIYKYNGDGKKIFYDTQDDDGAPPLNIPDFVQVGATLGNEFYLKYGPYKDVLELTSEKLDRNRHLISDPIKGIKDSARYHRWEKAYSDDNFLNLGDIHKAILPDFRVNEDTSWTKTVNLQVDFINMQDSVKFRLVDLTVENFVIEGESYGIEYDRTPTLINGIPKKVQIINSEGTGYYKYRISPRGFVREAIIEQEIDFDGLIVRDKFTQKVKQKMHWQLDKMLKY